MQQKLIVLTLCLLATFGGFEPGYAQMPPREVVVAFLNAWSEQNYPAMYNYIHPTSQQQYDAQTFAGQYATVAEKILLTGITYTIHNIQLQGSSAVVFYDLTLESTNFGTIVDEGRTMRLVNTPEGWKIAWSTMDIFDTLIDAEQLRVQSRPRGRATIYDRNGEVLAADDGATVAMFSQEQRMNDAGACIQLLGRIMRTPVLRLQRTFDLYVPETLFFLGEIPVEIYQEHRQELLDICGVGQQGYDIGFSTPQRTYLAGNAVAHVVGYVGQVTPEEEAQYGTGALIGRAGVEYTYQDILAGTPEKILRITEPQGTVLRELAGTMGTDPVPITLTIDQNLQLITVQALSDAFNYAAPNWGGVSTGGAAVVLDVNTGAILAMASYPLFDPILFNPASVTVDRAEALVEYVIDHPYQPLLNRATQEQYSPGSVFKIVTLAAILNEGLIARGEIFYCPLRWEGIEFGDTLEVRSDWRVMDDMEAAGEVTPAEALMTSCNPFFWQYAALLYDQVGGDALASYSRRLGLGQKYGFNGALIEVEGTLPTGAAADVAITEAVGQLNVAFPPLQLAVLTMSIANGGTVYKPYLVQQIGGREGLPVIETFESEILSTLDLNPGVLETIQEGMCGVVTNEELGTAWGRFHNWGPRGYVDITANYSVCGKTGTAQTARYPHAWFVAYAPAENPQIAVVVMVEQSREGSQVAAPIVRRILDDYFNQPRANYPSWWDESYVPLEIPEGAGLG